MLKENVCCSLSLLTQAIFFFFAKLDTCIRTANRSSFNAGLSKSKAVSSDCAATTVQIEKELRKKVI